MVTSAPVASNATSPFVEADGDVNDAVDTAYREKYRRYPSYVPPMVAPQARATTLKLVPEEAQ